MKRSLSVRRSLFPSSSPVFLSVCSVLLLLPVLFTGCGGGGGGSSSGPPSPYTGSTSAAVISQSTADNIAMGVYQAGAIGASAASPVDVSGSAAPGPVRPGLLAVVESLKAAADAVLARQILPAPGQVAPQAIFTDTGTLYDGYGGRLDYVLSIDDQTGAFNGTFTFVTFRGEGGGTASGTITVSGVVDLVTEEITQIRFNIASLSMTLGANRATLSGTIDITSSGTTTSSVMNLYMVDDTTHKAIWVQNLTVTGTGGTGSLDVSLSGRIYLHDYGYVDVSTPTPLHYLQGSDYPSSGVFVCTGGGNRKVRLTVNNAFTYTVSWDVDADGVYEGSATRSWP